jgi:hypothetical protein
MVDAVEEALTMTHGLLLFLAWALSGLATWIACLAVARGWERRHQVWYLTHALRSSLEQARAKLPQPRLAAPGGEIRASRIDKPINPRTASPVLGASLAPLFLPGASRTTR